MKSQHRYAFFITAIIYMGLIAFTPFQGQFLAKVLPIVVLLVAIMTTLSGRIRLLMAGAIMASGAGDVFLAYPMEYSFLFGLASFLLAHLIYTVAYFSHFNRLGSSLLIKGLILVIIVYATMMACYILPATGDLFIPVIIYLSVIAIMAIAALLSTLNTMVALGALTFILSDSVLALSVFKTPLPFSDYLLMTSYYLAQYLMVVGVMISYAQHPDKSVTDKS